MKQFMAIVVELLLLPFFFLIGDCCHDSSDHSQSADGENLTRLAFPKMSVVFRTTVDVARI